MPSTPRQQDPRPDGLPPIDKAAVLTPLLGSPASDELATLQDLYVSQIGSFGATYGSLGAAVGVMLWFYISAYAVLLGAELNARLEDTDIWQDESRQGG